MKLKEKVGNENSVKRLKKERYWVRGIDIKYPEFWEPLADISGPFFEEENHGLL